MRENTSQALLIGLGAVATLLFGVFVYREAFPEYRIYQKDYIKLAEFRSELTGMHPPAFNIGVKQILLEPEDKGNPIIDRCITCHVALEIPYFSPTKIAYDVNGTIQIDSEGKPIQVSNPDYIWLKLDEAIETLSKGSEADKAKAEEYRALKVAHVDEHEYDVTKVLRMHPLIGTETRPFEFHPVEEYGCVSCHGGNGRGIVTDRAHGPIFDGEYEIEDIGPVPHFTESDPENDPQFAKQYNAKPGHRLLFQTTPILLGSLIEANCVQCHASSRSALENATVSAAQTINQTEKRLVAIEKGLTQDKKALAALLKIRISVEEDGYEMTFEELSKQSVNFKLPPAERHDYASQVEHLAKLAGKTHEIKPEDVNKRVVEALDQELSSLLGRPELVKAFVLAGKAQKITPDFIETFLLSHRNNPEAIGHVFEKIEASNYIQELTKHITDSESSFSKAVTDQKFISALSSDVDDLTEHFHKGEGLYLSQACYACHKISGFARGGVGPELTREGDSYPWFVKQSIVWPQADLRTSTMPNMNLDHEDVEDLLTFVLAQKGKGKGVSESAYKLSVKSWDEGRKLPWEKPVSPTEMFDLNYSMTIFATEGCAACHRLKGYESNVGFAIEKEKPTWEKLYEERQWFGKLFPEDILGSRIVSVLEKHKDEIDMRIVDGVRKDSLLEAIQKEYPNTIETLFTPFKYAARAKNSYYQNLINSEKDPKKRADYEDQLKAWKERINRVLMVFIQEYGLGRLIGPRPNWSGVYRSDQWLMEHFRKPASLVPKSIMPVMPFDDTKFYALTYMLDVLGVRNRNDLKEIWDHNGFNAELAAHLLCSQCHGDYLQGNGPVGVWIYPIPKNLRDPDFLRNLTRERAIESIMHGIRGTPMAPWGEAATDKHVENKYPVLSRLEIERLVDWLFSTLPGTGAGNQDVPKWKYSPEDVLNELKKSKLELKKDDAFSFLYQFREGAGAYAAINPQVSEKPKEDVSTLFKIVPNANSGLEKESFYIKQEYYTKQNLEAGKAYFELNCAVCHGREGDGMGIRAEVMNDAKPQNLTNLDWMATHDDLRMLRSIKYGISGTSMVAWGDLTNILQRLQLVMYIRSLTKDETQREKLMTALYKGFDPHMQLVEKARIDEYAKLGSFEKELNALTERVSQFEDEVEQGKPLAKEASETYKKAVELNYAIAKQKKVDSSLKNVKAEIAHEQELYRNLGLELLGKDMTHKLWQNYFDAMASHQNRYAIEDGVLIITSDQKLNAQDQLLEKELLELINAHINSLKNENDHSSNNFTSSEQETELSKIKSQEVGYQKLQGQVMSTFEEARRSREKQQKLLTEFKEAREK